MADDVTETQWYAWWAGVQAAINRWSGGAPMENPYPEPLTITERLASYYGEATWFDPEPWERPFDHKRAAGKYVSAGTGFVYNPRTKEQYDRGESPEWRSGMIG